MRDELVEMLYAELEKAEKARDYHAAELQRAEVKVDVITDMVEEREKKLAEMQPAETVTEERYADGVLVDTETVAVE